MLFRIRSYQCHRHKHKCPLANSKSSAYLRMLSPWRVDFAHSKGKNHTVKMSKKLKTTMQMACLLTQKSFFTTSPQGPPPHANTSHSHAPGQWQHSCRRRHPAAAARSPRDHWLRHSSAPSFRPARAAAPNVPPTWRDSRHLSRRHQASTRHRAHTQVQRDIKFKSRKNKMRQKYNVWRFRK